MTFKSVLFVPQNQPGESFNRYGSKTDHIKVRSCVKVSLGQSLICFNVFLHCVL